MLRTSLCRLRLRTYFDVLGLPLTAASRQVDTAHLQKTLHMLQRRFHPDALVGKSQEEIARCEITAARVNSAYKIIREDFARHRYIAYCVALFHDKNFESKGKAILAAVDSANTKDDDNNDIRESDNGNCDPEHIVAVLDESSEIKLGEELPVNFLERMMEYHEEIENAQDGGDDGDDGAAALTPERREQMLKEMDSLANESRAICEKCLAEHGAEFFQSRLENFSASESGSKPLSALSEAARAAQSEYLRAVLRWTYAKNLQDKLKAMS